MKHRPVNPLVGGSNPSRGAMKNSHLSEDDLSNIPGEQVPVAASLDGLSQSILDTGSILAAPTNKQQLAIPARKNGQQLASNPAPDCPRCSGTGSCDSGGEMPWGAPIDVRCDCTYPPPPTNTGQQVASSAVAEEDGDQILTPMPTHCPYCVVGFTADGKPLRPFVLDIGGWMTCTRCKGSFGAAQP